MSPGSDMDAALQVRLDVAEMKGMLTVALQNHGERIVTLESSTEKINTRLNEKARRLATVETEMRDTRADVTELQTLQRGQFGRSLQTLVGLAAIAGLVLALWQAVMP